MSFLSLFDDFREGKTFSQFGEGALWLRSHFHVAIAIASTYLLLIPSVKFLMSQSEPFHLKRPLQAWNLFLCIFSVIGVKEVAFPLVRALYTRGFHYTVCGSPVETYGSGSAGLWLLLFIYSKTPELFDTLFLLLRKKHIEFLHWYHHASVLLFSWYAMGALQPTGPWFASMNLIVHSIMYFYYFLTASGFTPQWGVFVTQLQITQMIMGLLLQLGTVYYKWIAGDHCIIDYPSLAMGLIIYFSYFLLFISFFFKRWKRPSSTPASSIRRTNKQNMQDKQG